MPDLSNRIPNFGRASWFYAVGKGVCLDQPRAARPLESALAFPQSPSQQHCAVEMRVRIA